MFDCLSLWRNSTNDYKNFSSIKITNFLRANLLKSRADKTNRISKSLKNLSKNQICKRGLTLKKFFGIWSSNLKKNQLGLKAVQIQSNIRKRNSVKLMNRNLLSSHLNSFYKRKFLDDLKKSSNEIRDVSKRVKKTNNFDFGKIYITNNLCEPKRKEDDRKFIIQQLRVVEYRNSMAILKKFFDLWKIKSKGYFKKIILVQKFMRRFMSNISVKRVLSKLNRTKMLLHHFIAKFNNPDKDKKSLYFRRFYNNTFKSHLIAKVIKIQKAFSNYLKNKKRKRLLSENKIKKFSHKNFLKNLSKQVKMYRFLSSLKNLSRKKILKDIKGHVDFLKLRSHKLNTLQIIRRRVEKNELIPNYFKKWNGFSDYSRTKENYSAQKITGLFRIIVSLKKLRDLRKRNYLLKRLTNVNSLKFQILLSQQLNKWKTSDLTKKIGDSANTIQKFIRNNLQRVKDNRAAKISHVFRRLSAHKDQVSNRLFSNKIYKVFAYKVLKSFVNCIKENLKRKQIPDSLKIIKRKIVNKQALSSCTYYKTKRGSAVSIKPSLFSFKCTTSSNDIIGASRNGNVKLIANLNSFKILHKLINRRKLEALKHLVDKQKLINKLVKVSEHFRKLSGRMMYKKFIPYMLALKSCDKLRTLVKKKYLNNLRDNSAVFIQIYNLSIFLRVVYRNKEIAKNTYIKEILRKWRLMTMLRIMIRKKMGVMYKNMHSFYLNIADEIFNEDGEAINMNVERMMEKFSEYDTELTHSHVRFAESKKNYVPNDYSSIISTNVKTYKKLAYSKSPIRGINANTPSNSSKKNSNEDTGVYTRPQRVPHHNSGKKLF
jgi:hypothetical protein